MLDTYQPERKPHARKLVRLAVRVGWSMTVGGRRGNLLRRFLVPWLERRADGCEAAASSATPTLRDSALVIKSFRRGELAGTLCPNPLPAEGSRFDDVVGVRFALVTSSPLTQAQRELLGRRGAAVISVSAQDETRPLAGQLGVSWCARPTRPNRHAHRAKPGRIMRGGTDVHQARGNHQDLSKALGLVT